MSAVISKKAKIQTIAKVLNFNKVSRVISDWDDTITDKDTIGLSFDVLKTVKPDCPYDQNYFFKVYMDRYDEFLKTQLPLEWYSSRNTLAKEIEYQKNIKEVELSSLYKCVELKVFEGVPETVLSKQSEKVIIKPGFEEFYKTLVVEPKIENKIEFNVLSINWTGKFIGDYFQSKFNKLPKRVISNEFEIVNGKCTGDVDSSKNIRTGLDKLEEVKKIYTHEDYPKETWFIGDSSTDVLSMIECDKGIIMKGGSATKTLNKLGYKVYDIDNNDMEIDALHDLKFFEINDWSDLLDIYNASLS